MKYVFQINHPAHYHLTKNVIKNLKDHGHEVFIVARGKDVLEELLKGEDYVMLKQRKGRTLFQKLNKQRAMKKELEQVIAGIKPDVVIGTGIFGFLSKRLGVKTFLLVEDDITTNPMLFLSAFLTYWDYTEILSPLCCHNWIFERKSTKYSSYHELSYLHPNHFEPDRSVADKYVDTSRPYFILRFVKLNAYHDLGIKGINNECAGHLIDMLKPYGKIYITSERELEPEFEQYRISVDAKDMIHVMSYAQLFICDSQTMAAESGVLGVPYVRFNDFVDKLGYLKELEDVYKLGYGVKASAQGPQRLYEVVDELLRMDNRKEVFQVRRFSYFVIVTAVQLPGRRSSRSFLPSSYSGILRRTSSSQARADSLEKEKAELEAANASLKSMMEWYRKKLFGKMSEKNLPLDPSALEPSRLTDTECTSPLRGSTHILTFLHNKNHNQSFNLKFCSITRV